MYGEVRPVIVYGFIEPNHNKYLDWRFLVSQFGEECVRIYATELVRWHAYQFVYGIEINLSDNFSERDERYDNIDRLAAMFNNPSIKPEIMSVIAGDFMYGSTRESYVLDI